MKKINKILTLSFASLMLFGCDDILAKPAEVLNGNNIVSFGNGNNAYYDNDFEVIYDQMVDSGTSNSTILKELLNIISRKEISVFYDLTAEELETVLSNVTATLAHKTASPLTKDAAKTLEGIILDHVKDTMVEKAKGGSYSVDNLFQEEKLVNELRTSLYTIGGDDFTVDYLITPDSEYEDIFRGDYTDYIERNIYPDLLKELLTSIYLYGHEYTTLGRAYAREVEYIKLETISTHKDSVSVLINSYFKAFMDGKTPTGNFDLDSLARIYKGVFDAEELKDSASLSAKEYQFAVDNFVTTKEDVLEEELTKVGTFDETTGEYVILDDKNPNKDNDLVSTYTGSYSYPVSWGKTLKDRELAKLDLVTDEDLVIKSGGVSDLPSEMRNRLFSSSIASYCTTLSNTAGTESISLLLPKSTPNGEVDPLTKYAYFDTSSNAYYIILVNGYYNTTSLKNGKEGADNFSQETKDKALEIARILGTTSNNQKDAIIYYLDKYNLSFGDQKFYDYIEDTYPDVLDDNY